MKGHKNLEPSSISIHTLSIVYCKAENLVGVRN